MSIGIYSNNLYAGNPVFVSKVNSSRKSDADKTEMTSSNTKASNPETSQQSNPIEDAKIKAVVQELVQTQIKVIAHEQAHMAAGGMYAGGASYSYTQGPDGKRYITGGEVPISIPAIKDPAEKIIALRRVISAAMAPADPSPQDRSVASSASSKLAQAQMELNKKNAQELYSNVKVGTSSSPEKTTGSTIDLSI